MVTLPIESRTLPDIQATEALARRVAAALREGDVIHLDGPMGAGKTTFTRALVAAVGGDPEAVASPTYTLLHRYEGVLPVVHVDAYRLSGGEELDGIGFVEACEGAVAVVEWAQRVGIVADEGSSWVLQLDHSGDGGRLADITPPRGRSW